jgi:hypothetical protein
MIQIDALNNQYLSNSLIYYTQSGIKLTLCTGSTKQHSVHNICRCTGALML